MGRSDHRVDLHVRRPDRGPTVASRCPTEHVVPHEVPVPSPGRVYGVRGLRDLVGASVYASQEAHHWTQAGHDGLQCLPSRVFLLAVLGGK
ncbi:hypothetical protein Pmani_035279 [Petrolisthes manimaculis]|uniref:Uncharacterized protein n=1 Tax=Petrolisthes manimaculis TaxID=1843537 RepID=A0AAE1NMP4_9EUCA|nr:hypothetical protein Pmani_035279 [Petrolisthes manimaculis]